MGNAQSIAALIRGIRDANIDRIPNLENAIERIATSQAAYPGEERLKELIDAVFAERDTMINDLLTFAVPRIVEEVKYSLAVDRALEQDPTLLNSSPPAEDSFEQLFAPISRK